MKTEQVHVDGTVFRYPYLWRHRAHSEEPPPKHRTVCLIFKLKAGPRHTSLAIVAISDRAGDDPMMSIRVPEEERLRAGLNEFRNAFIHLDQYNVDRAGNSHNFDPGTRILGQFSGHFVGRLAAALAANIRAKRATRIDRS